MILVHVTAATLPWKQAGTPLDWLPKEVKDHLAQLFTVRLYEILEEKLTSAFSLAIFKEKYWLSLTEEKYTDSVSDKLLNSLVRVHTDVMVANDKIEDRPIRLLMQAMYYGLIAKALPPYAPFQEAIHSTRSRKLYYWREFLTMNEEYISNLAEESMI
jgi:hypothetical protein